MLLQDCFWPVDDNGGYYCSWVDGMQTCPTGEFCGSNLDLYGKPKFSNPEAQRAADFEPILNFGYTGFDSIFAGMTTVFQSITTEGWSDVMYKV